MIITEAAEERIRLLSPDGPFKIETHGSMDTGWHVDLVPNAESTSIDVTISSDPWVIADFLSVSRFALNTIDVVNDEFVLS